MVNINADSDLVLTSERADLWTPPIVGGKGANLEQLLLAEVDVPEFYCVTTHAYRLFAAQDEVSTLIRRMLSELYETKELGKIEKISGRMAESLAFAPVPRAVEQAVLEIHDHIFPGTCFRVAVRSSATAEDLKSASFAGQHESYLSITNADELISSIRMVWISLWSARAIVYRQRLGIDHLRVRMAVVVQRMVDAEISGVLFTNNPVSGSSMEMLINAAPGMGEHVVSGKTTPFEGVISRPGGTLLRVRSGKSEAGLPGDAAEGIDLTEAQVRDLCLVGERLERWFGDPLDLEWSISRDKLYVLQARPITAGISEEDDDEKGATRPTVEGYWMRAGFEEWFRKPLSPLFATAVLPVMNHRAFDLVNELLGVDLKTPRWRTVDGFFYVRGELDSRWSVVALPVRLVRNCRRVIDAWHDRIFPSIVEETRALNTEARADDPIARLVKKFDSALEIASKMWSWLTITGIYGKFLEGLFAFIYRLVSASDSSFYAVLLSGFSNKSTEADQMLWELASRAREHQQLLALVRERSYPDARGALRQTANGTALLAMFDDWVRLHGHRLFDLDVSQPTYRDLPHIAWALVRQIVTSSAQPPNERLSSRAKARDEAKTRILPPRTLNPARVFLRWLLPIVRRYYMIREDRPYYMSLCLGHVRRIALEIGETLEKEGVLAKASDVFFLTDKELRTLAREKHFEVDGLKSRISKRQRVHGRQSRHQPKDEIGKPPLLARVIISLLGIRRRAQVRRDELLTGIAASGGVSRGIARVVQEPEEFVRFKKGEILVTRFTTPAWTPLFSLAHGVATEVGGSLSHAAIAAREYDIPAVVGIEGLLDAVKDGIAIEVDGTAGQVKVL